MKPKAYLWVGMLDYNPETRQHAADRIRKWRQGYGVALKLAISGLIGLAFAYGGAEMFIRSAETAAIYAAQREAQLDAISQDHILQTHN